MAGSERIYQQPDSFYESSDEVTELFMELFSAMLLLQEDIKAEISHLEKIKPSTKEELYRRLHYAKDFIDSCYTEVINLDIISQVACLNREYFIRQFKNQFKITPAQYIIRRRMETARQLLLRSDMSVLEICQHVGYFDVSTFGKLFRRYFHHSPSTIRQLIS